MQHRALEFVRVGQLSDIPRGEGRICVIEGKEIALFHLDNGGVLAVENRCPHQNGPLVHGIVAGDTVTCPLHGWKIDLKTGETLGEGGRAAAYPVRIEKGDVWIGFE